MIRVDRSKIDIAITNFAIQEKNAWHAASNILLIKQR